jgi:hypothetical protein
MCAPTTTKKTSSSSSSSSSPPLRSLSSLSDESAAAAVVVINDSNNGKNNDNTKKEATSTSDNGGGIIDKIWPLHPSIVIVIMAIFVPSRCFLNRGFTIWFHWISILHLFTQFQSKFIEKFLILSGTSISLGWYSTLLWECIYHGRFFDALYNNVDVLYDYMPSFVMSSHPLIPITIIHVFDLLGHPLLTYYFWRRYNNINNNNNISNTTIPTPPNGDNDNNKNNESIHIVDEICTWPVLIAAYLFSRTWSIVHTYHNFGYFGLFYVGFDVYIIDSLDMWYPAYIAETILYSSLVLRKSLN